VSTHRTFLAVRTLGLSLLGAGAFAVADAGCGGVTATDLCQQLCDCTGCNATQRQACESSFNDSQKLAGDKGCADTYSAYVSCVDGHFQCVGNTLDLAACATETAALGTCTGETSMVQMTPPTTAACDLVNANSHICTMYSDLTASLVKSSSQACVQAMGTVVAACPPAGALGVCKVSTGGITTSVTYYSEGGITADNAKTACMSGSGTWTPG
jgi:hypothetical protein